jgi:hypothetical protein
MKLTLQKIAFFVVLLLNAQIVLGAPGDTPPPPTPPPPPGLSIDGSLVAMFFVALLLGYVLSKKYILTKKGS